MCGQALNLLNVENGIALHEVDFTLGVIAGLLIGFLAGDGIGIHHKRALLAFANMSAQFHRLAKRHPDRGGKASCQMLRTRASGY